MKKIFDHIRYLDAAGRERVRVDFREGEPVPIQGEDLQDKSHRPYFYLTAPQSPGQFYVSELNLNIEQKIIERPFEPVIRYATPVHVGGKLAGIIVFNLLAGTDRFLHFDTPRSGRTENYILSNREGFYLHHPDDSKEWGFMEELDRSDQNAREDYAEAASQILSGQPGVVRLVSGETIAYAPVSFHDEPGGDAFWVLLKRIKSVAYPVSANVWFDEATEAINSGLAMSELAGDMANNAMMATITAATRELIVSLVLLTLAVMIFVFFAFWSRSRILLPIQHLIGVTEKIAGGDLSQRVKALGGSEFGRLGESFNSMTQERNEMQAAVEEKNAALEKALAEIKTLRGIVPICAHCKQIRDDTGFWQQVEVYVRDRTEAEFSHGICPECIKEFYPEFEVDK